MKIRASAGTLHTAVQGRLSEDAALRAARVRGPSFAKAASRLSPCWLCSSGSGSWAIRQRSQTRVLSRLTRFWIPLTRLWTRAMPRRWSAKSSCTATVASASHV